MVVLKNALSHGRRAAITTAAGCSTGQVGWGVAAIAGIAAALATSVVAFTVVKWIGVAYLAYLGARSIANAVRRRRNGETMAAEVPALPTPGWARLARSPYRNGLFTNALNPKTALFMSALVPQFVVRGGPWWQLPSMVLITAVVSFCWMSFYAVLFAKVGDVLRAVNVRRMIDGAIGVVLVSFGVRLAFAQQ